MCERHANDRPQPLWPGLAASPAAAPSTPLAPTQSLPLPLPPQPAGGSRRKRLWELPASCHCPIVGVCLPLSVARRLVDKAVGGQAQADDYEIHVGLVNDCRQRSPIAENVQRELETRYALTVKRFAAAKTPEGVLACFNATADAGDLAGALWAAVTHARCDAVVQDAIYRIVHMRQHQAGAMARADLKKSARIADEHAAQGREIERLQARLQQLQAERGAELERAEAQLVRLRAEAIARDSTVAGLRQQLADLQQTVPDLASRIALSARVTELGERQSDLLRQLAEARQQAEQAERRAESAALRHASTAEAAPPDGETGEERVIPIHLGARSVLCVGGRHAAISVYRELVERHGGRFIHHDGGREDNARALDASLAAADLVICQAGCISHNAYWLVKDHCKRTGKRCVYVDKPSAASFAKGLAALPEVRGTTPEPAD